jgi:three-Cys-motif partner protein
VGGRRFDEAFGELLDFYVRRGRPLPPTFAFIDPFGWTGVPFQLVKTILSYSSCEVLLNFMYEEINRFIGHPDQETNLDSLFGTPNWRPIVTIQGPVERRAAIHGLIKASLAAAPSTFGRSRCAIRTMLLTTSSSSRPTTSLA